MAVEMVGRDVGEDADMRVEAGHQVDLEGREFQHIDAALGRLAQQEHCFADVAADINIKTRLLQDVPDERGGR